MAIFPKRDEKRKTRWYFGGCAACCSTMLTHPLDLLKVLLQTQEGKGGIGNSIQTVYNNNGIKGFYSGLSAALARQATYTTSRFAFYELGKQFMNSETFVQKALLGISAGVLSGGIGVPMDIVNVRMQNDMKLPMEKRRNYKHVGDGLLSTYREGGKKALFSGGTFAIMRGCLMTIGQNAVYDEVKPVIREATNASDGVALHIMTSLFAALTATLLTQPMDVVKTRVMNAAPGEYSGNVDVILKTAKEGPLAFYKGLIPAFLRLGPQTILIFVVMEQLRLYFGYYENKISNTVGRY